MWPKVSIARSRVQIKGQTNKKPRTYRNKARKDYLALAKQSGTILDRDRNAALNILAKGLKQSGINLNTAGHAEINAWGQNNLYSMVATSTSKLTD